LSQCIKELSLDDRPREKLMQQGAAGLSNSELLAILIRTGTQKRSALRIAEELTASSGLYQNIACVVLQSWLKSRDWGPQKLQQFWLRWN
jgi:DNA repair protein RadC